MSLGIDGSALIQSIGRLTGVVEKSTAAAKASSGSISSDKGINIDATAMAAEAAAKYDARIERTDASIKENEEKLVSLAQVKAAASNLKFATDAITDNVTNIVSAVTISGGLQNALTATAVEGASPNIYNVTVNQIANVETWILEGLNGSISQPFTSKTTSVVAATVTSGMFCSGDFTIQATVNGVMASAFVTLATGDSLDAIVAKIQTALNAANIPVTAGINSPYAGNYQIIMESNGTGTVNSFQVTSTENVFTNIYSHSAPACTSAVCLYQDSHQTAWSSGNLDTLTANSYIQLNGVMIPIGAFTSTDPSVALPALATAINAAYNANKQVTDPQLFVQSISQSGSFYLKFTTTSPQGIDIQLPTIGGVTFCSPSHLSYTGQALNASVTIGNLTYTPPTNTFTPTLPAGDIESITVSGTGGGQINVGYAASWEVLLNGLIDSVNAVQQEIAKHSQTDDKQAATTSLFAEPVITDLQGMIYSIMNLQTTVGRNTITNLADIGIGQVQHIANPDKGEFETTYLQILDNAKLQSVLSNPLTAMQVGALFAVWVKAFAMSEQSQEVAGGLAGKFASADGTMSTSIATDQGGSLSLVSPNANYFDAGSNMFVNYNNVAVYNIGISVNAEGQVTNVLLCNVGSADVLESAEFTPNTQNGVTTIVGAGALTGLVLYYSPPNGSGVDSVESIYIPPQPHTMNNGSISSTDQSGYDSIVGFDYPTAQVGPNPNAPRQNTYNGPAITTLKIHSPSLVLRYFVLTANGINYCEPRIMSNDTQALQCDQYDSATCAVPDRNGVYTLIGLPDTALAGLVMYYYNPNVTKPVLNHLVDTVIFSDYIPPSATIVPAETNDATLVLASADLSFNDSPFNVYITNLGGVLKAMIVQYVQESSGESLISKFPLDVTNQGANSATITGRTGTPFASLVMNYSYDRLVSPNEANIFTDIRVIDTTRGIFSQSALELQYYLNPATGCMARAFSATRSTLSEYRAELTEEKQEQSSASEQAKVKANMVKLQIDLADEIHQRMTDMLSDRVRGG